MELNRTGIYPFICAYLDECKILRFSPGDVIARASDQQDRIYYLIEGKTRETATTSSGKVVDVDMNVEDEFTGHLSNHWGQNFYCDTTAITRCTLVFIPQSVFRTLMKESEFQAFFYRKTSTRLYEMYKLTLAREMFSQRQLFAYYLLNSLKEDTIALESIEGTARYLHISRRNLYNLLDSFTEAGYVERLDNRALRVVDKEALKKLASPVKRYMYNEI